MAVGAEDLTAPENPSASGAVEEVSVRPADVPEHDGRIVQAGRDPVAVGREAQRPDPDGKSGT
jgi:hypothetical protein